MKKYTLKRGTHNVWRLSGRAVLILLLVFSTLSSLIAVHPPASATSLQEWETDGFSQIATGLFHSCAITTTHKVWCWGRNQYGQLGNNSTTDSSVPVAVDTSGVLAGKTVTDVAVDVYTSCVVASGAAYCWGNNPNGQLGNNSTTDSSVPVAVDTSGVLAGKTVTAITAVAIQEDAFCALANGLPYCWGRGGYGQLGNNSTTDSSIPVAVTSSGVLAGKTITSIAGTCVIASGQAYCWGSNMFSELGNNTSSNSSVPVAVDTSGVLAGKTITSMYTGYHMTCVLAGGQAYCWGWNATGGYGDGTTTTVLVPVAVDTSGVLAGKTITSLAVGGGYVCALSGGQTYCWGDNQTAEYGNGTRTGSLVPVLIDRSSTILAGKTLTSISAGGSVCGLTGTTAYCWGSGDSYGELGDAHDPSQFIILVPSIVAAGHVTIDAAQYTVSADGLAHPITVRGTYFRSGVVLNLDGQAITSGGTFTDGSGFDVTVPAATTDKTVVLTATNPDGQSASTNIVYVAPRITTVDFSANPGDPTTQLMNVHGTNLDTSEHGIGLTQSLVTLNGNALGFCTTPTYSSAVLAGAGINPAYYSDNAPCYIALDDALPGIVALTPTLYQIRVPASFDTSAYSVQIAGVAQPYVYSSSPVSPGRSYINNLSVGFTVTDASNVNLDTIGTVNNQSLVTLKADSGTLVAEIPVDTSTTRDWSAVTAGVDVAKKMAFAHGLVTAPGANSATFALYVPKGSTDNAVIVCPGAMSLSDIRTNCPNARTYHVHDSAITIVHDANGQAYWKIVGLTGTGGISIHDSLVDTGLFIVGISSVAATVLVGAVVVVYSSSRSKKYSLRKR